MRALSIACVAACSSGPSFTGGRWLVNEVMTMTCAGATKTTAYPVSIAFYTDGSGIAYYDVVVHCSPSFTVTGNTATLTEPPAGCSTIIDQAIAPIDITQASITSSGSSMLVTMSGNATVDGGVCAISVEAPGVR